MEWSVRLSVGHSLWLEVHPWTVPLKVWLSKGIAICLSRLGFHLSACPSGDLFTCLKSVCLAVVMPGFHLSEWWRSTGVHPSPCVIS